MEEIKDIEQEFIEYISTIKDIQLLVFKLDIDKKRQYMGKVYNFNPSEDDLYEIIKNKYGSGEFYIQSKNGNRLGKGITLYIAAESKEKQETINNSLEKKIDTLIEVLSQKQQQKEEDTEEKFLHKLQLYKNIFETKNNFDSSVFIKEMIKAYREGLETGKTIINPPEQEKKDILETLLPTLLLSMQQQKVIKPQSDINQKENQQGFDMYKYIVLFNKVKSLANENDIERFKQKINTIVFDIIDFYPEVLQFLKLINNDNIDFYVNEIRNRYKINITENEKIVILRLIDELKKIEIETENETANNNA